MFGSVIWNAFYLSALCIITAQCRCKAVINEINFIDPRKPETKEFIELKSTCEEDLPLRGYKLIGFNCQAKSGKVALVVSLWNERMKNRFFTIGGSDVDTADLKIPDAKIRFKDGFPSKNKVQQLTNFLSSENRLYAIGLLYGEKQVFNEFKLTEKIRELVIDTKLIDILKKHLVDLVVYSENNACDKCTLFEDIHSDFFGKKYTLREFSTNIEKKDITLNRCALESFGFIPEKFKIGLPTPGKPNDCSGPHFILEDNLLSAIPPVLTHSFSDDYDDLTGASCSAQPECFSSIEPSDYNQITEQGIEQALHNANSSAANNICTPLLLYPDGGEVLQTIVNDNNRKRHMSSDADYSEDFEWKTIKYFRYF